MRHTLQQQRRYPPSSTTAQLWGLLVCAFRRSGSCSVSDPLLCVLLLALLTPHHHRSVACKPPFSSWGWAQLPS